MTDPFDSAAFNKALKPFFASRFAYTARRGNVFHRGSINGCLFDSGLDSPLADDGVAVSSARRTWTLTIQMENWPSPSKNPPAIGDVFELAVCGSIVRAAAEKIESSVFGEHVVYLREVVPV